MQEEELIDDLVELINDIYNDLLGRLPSFVSKRVLIPHKVRRYAKRITSISQKYVEAKIKQMS